MSCTKILTPHKNFAPGSTSNNNFVVADCIVNMNFVVKSRLDLCFVVDFVVGNEKRQRVSQKCILIDMFSTWKFLNYLQKYKSNIASSFQLLLCFDLMQISP